jgi:hypothetical protein
VAHFLRRRTAASCLLELQIRIPTRSWISVVSVVCCQVEVSASGWSLVQRSPTECGVSNRVWSQSYIRRGHDSESDRSAQVRKIKKIRQRRADVIGGGENAQWHTLQISSEVSATVLLRSTFFQDVKLRNVNIRLTGDAVSMPKDFSPNIISVIKSGKILWSGIYTTH